MTQNFTNKLPLIISWWCLVTSVDATLLLLLMLTDTKPYWYKTLLPHAYLSLVLIIELIFSIKIQNSQHHLNSIEQIGGWLKFSKYGGKKIGDSKLLQQRGNNNQSNLPESPHKWACLCISTCKGTTKSSHHTFFFF